MANNQKKKKEENPVIEWISDNLRYIELGVVIVLVLVAAILGIRALAGRGNSAKANEPAAVSASSAKTEDVKEEVKETKASSEAVKAESEEKTPAEATLAVDEGVVAEAVNTYLNGLLANGESGDVDSYSNIQTYAYTTAENQADGSQIVFVRYQYTEAGTGVEIPGLTELYVQIGEDGSAEVLTEVSDAQSAQMTEAASSQAAQALIETVQAEYDKATSENQE